jgi:hypothetical protein
VSHGCDGTAPVTAHVGGVGASDPLTGGASLREQLWVLKTSGGASVVAMMESTDPRQRNHPAATGREHGPRRRRVLVERDMRAVGVVVGHVLAKHSAQVGRTRDDEVVRALPPKAADDPLDVGVCQGECAALTTCSMPSERTAATSAVPRVSGCVPAFCTVIAALADTETTAKPAAASTAPPTFAKAARVPGTGVPATKSWNTLDCELVSATENHTA